MAKKSRYEEDKKEGLVGGSSGSKSSGARVSSKSSSTMTSTEKARHANSKTMSSGSSGARVSSKPSSTMTSTEKARHANSKPMSTLVSTAMQSTPQTIKAGQTQKAKSGTKTTSSGYDYDPAKDPEIAALLGMNVTQDDANGFNNKLQEYSTLTQHLQELYTAYMKEWQAPDSLNGLTAEFDKRDAMVKEMRDFMGAAIASGAVDEGAFKEIQDALLADDDVFKTARENLTKAAGFYANYGTAEDYDAARSEYADYVKDNTYGNIDLTDRPVIHWDDQAIADNADALASLGISPDDVRGSDSTVLGAYGNYDGVDVAYTPIIATPGGGKVLDQQTIDQYIQGLIAGLGEGWTSDQLLAADKAGADVNGIHISGIIAEVGPRAAQVSTEMHDRSEKIEQDKQNAAWAKEASSPGFDYDAELEAFKTLEALEKEYWSDNARPDEVIFAKAGVHSAEELHAKVEQGRKRDQFLRIYHASQRIADKEEAAKNDPNFAALAAEGRQDDAWRKGLSFVFNGIFASAAQLWGQMTTGVIPGTTDEDYYAAMTEDETNLASYLRMLEKRGEIPKGSTVEYLRDIQGFLSDRIAQKGYDITQENFKDHEWLKLASEVLFGTVSSVGNYISSVDSLRYVFTDRDYIAPTADQSLGTKYKSNDLQGHAVFDMLYDLGSNLGNMAIPTATGMAVTALGGPGAAVSGAMLGAGAAGQAYAEMINQGYSRGQASIYAAITGVSEATLETILNGISGLGEGGLGKFIGDKIKAAAPGLSKGMARFAIRAGTFVGDTLSETIEEGLQEALSPMYQWMLSGEWDGIDWGQVAYAGALGALCSAPFNFVNVIGARAGFNDMQAVAREAIQNHDMDTLLRIAQAFEEDSFIQMIAEQYMNIDEELYEELNGENKESRKKRDIYARNIATAMEMASEQVGVKIEKTISDILTENGVSDKDVKRITSLVQHVFDSGRTQFTVGERMRLNELEALDAATAALRAVTDSNGETVRLLQDISRATGGDGDVRGVDWAAYDRDVAEAQRKAENAQAVNDEFYNGAFVTREGNRQAVSQTDVDSFTSPEGMDELPLRIEEGEDGQRGVVTESGEFQDFNNVYFTADKAAVMAPLLINRDITTQDANAILEAVKTESEAAGGSLRTAYEHVMQAFRRGEAGMPALAADSFSSEAAAAAHKVGYDIGQSHYDARMSEQQQRIAAARNAGRVSPEQEQAMAASRETLTGKQTAGEALTESEQAQLNQINSYFSQINKAKRKGKVDFIGNAHGLNARQRVGLAVVGNVTAMITHNNVHIFNSVKNESGQLVLETDLPALGLKAGALADNGFYDPKTGDIYLDANSGKGGKGAILWTFGHELTHFISAWSPEHFRQLAEFVAASVEGQFAAGETIYSVEDLVKRKQLQSRDAGMQLTFAEAMEEFVADGLQTMFTDTNLLSKVVQLATKDKPLVQKLAGWAAKTIEKIKSLYSDLLDYDVTEANILRNDVEALERISDVFAEGLVSAGDTYKMLTPRQQSAADAAALGDVDMQGDAQPHLASLRSFTAACGFAVERDEKKKTTFYYVDSAGKKQVITDPKKQITVERIKNSPIGAIVDLAANPVVGKDGQIADAAIDEKEATKQYEFLRDMMIMAAEGKEMTMRWEFAGAMAFSPIRSNSDTQYKRTVDFSTICRKTQSMINSMSEFALQILEHDPRHVGRGLTPKEIRSIAYKVTGEFGEPTPCPVCYVFSRWMGTGGILTDINRFQHKFKNYSEQDLRRFADRVEAFVVEYAKKNNKDSYYNKDGKLRFGKVLSDIVHATDKKAQEIEQRIEDHWRIYGMVEELQATLDKGTLDQEQAAILKKRITQLKRKLLSDKNYAKKEQELADLTKEGAFSGFSYDDFKAYQWMKRVRFAGGAQVKATQQTGAESMEDSEAQAAVESENADQDEVGNASVRNLVYRTDYDLVPPEILFDMRRTAEWADNPLWAGSWEYRNTRGNAAGKAILPYSEAFAGETLQGLATSPGGLKKLKRTAEQGNPFLTGDKAGQQQVLAKAIHNMLIQNLIGGTRYQSTSDFRHEFGSDYLMTFLEMQAARSNVQLYTKVIEAVDMFASMGADVNMSAMGKGKGFNVITDADGNQHIELDFSSVTGIDAAAAMQMADKYDNAQIILVGFNDTHIRAAINSRYDLHTPGDGKIIVDFCIPFHASGNALTVIQELMDLLGEEMPIQYVQDYSKVQVEHEMSEAYCAKTGRDYAQLESRRKLRKKILTGKDGGSTWTPTDAELAEISSNEILNSLYQRLYVDKNAPEYGIRFPGDVADHIFPWEYWDKTLKYKDAHLNGQRFIQYCDYLGLFPRFSGVTDGGGTKATYIEDNTLPTKKQKKIAFGDFTADWGYWKLLIDRRMYDRKGNYREQQHINASNFSAGMIDPTVAAHMEYASAIQKDSSSDPSVAKAIGRECYRRLEEQEQKAKEGRAKAQAQRADVKRSTRITPEAYPDLYEELESGPHIRGLYRTMELINGKLHSPMATYMDGKLVPPYELLGWYRSDERIDLTRPYNAKKEQVWDDNWNDWALYFPLKKRVNGELDTVWARYNPYEHHSNTMFNDQLSVSYKRPNLVVVEFMVPETEQTSPYWAERAKDPTGWLSWHTGQTAAAIKHATGTERKLFLSRYTKPLRIVPFDEVVDHYAGLMLQAGVSISDAVIPPWLIDPLKQRGATVTTSGKVKYDADGRSPWLAGMSEETKQALGIWTEAKRSIRIQPEDAATPRGILSGAMEGVARTDDERKTLRRYQKQIGRYNEQETRLRAFEEAINKLRAAKKAKADNVPEMSAGAIEKSDLIPSAEDFGRTFAEKLGIETFDQERAQQIRRKYIGMLTGGVTYDAFYRFAEAAAKSALQTGTYTEETGTADLRKDFKQRGLDSMYLSPDVYKMLVDHFGSAGDMQRAFLSHGLKYTRQKNKGGNVGIDAWYDELLGHGESNPFSLPETKDPVSQLENVFSLLEGSDTVQAPLELSADQIEQTAATATSDLFNAVLQASDEAALGRSTTKLISALQRSANDAADRIAAYDKQLLTLEATEPLQKVVQRAKAQGKASERARGDARLQRQRETMKASQEKAIAREKARTERANLRVEELINREKERRVKQKERGIRDRITGMRKQIAAQLLNGRGKQSIPEEVVDSVMAIVEAIDPLSGNELLEVTQNGGHRIVKDTSQYTEDEIRLGLESGRFLRNKAYSEEETLRGRLENLRQVYDRMRFSNEYHELGSELGRAGVSGLESSMNQYLDQLTKAIGDKPLRDLTLGELEDVYAIMHGVVTQITSANKQIDQDLRYDNYPGVQQTVTMFQKRKAQNEKRNKAQNAAGKVSDAFLMFGTSAIRAVREMTEFNEESELYKKTKALEDGQLRMYRFRMLANKRLEETRQGKEDRAAYAEATQEPFQDLVFTDVDGNEFQASKMQVLQYLMTYFREVNNEDHAHLQGMTFFPDYELLAKGKRAKAYESAHVMGPVGEDVIAKIIEVVNEDEWCLRYLEAAQEVLYDMSSNAINATSAIMYGVPIARDAFYIPYKTNRDYVARDPENAKFDGTINGIGLLQHTVAHSTTPLIMDGLNIVLDQHINDVAKVYGLQIPIRNINLLMNGRQTVNDGGESVRDALRGAYGESGLELIDRMISDVQSPRRSDNSAAIQRMIAKMKGLAVNATLSGSISVRIKQAASYFSAGVYLDDVALAAGLEYVKHYSPKWERRIFDEIDRWTPLHYMRRIGVNGIPELAEMNQGGRMTRFISDHPAIAKASPYNWVQGMDVDTTAALWVACKNQIKRDKTLGLDPDSWEYYKAVADLYNRVLFDTQPMYDPLHRAEIQKSPVLGNIIMFQTQPLQNAGILRESNRKASLYRAQFGKKSQQYKQAAKQNRMAVKSQIAAAVVFAAMTMVAQAINHRVDDWRDKDGNVTPLSTLATLVYQSVKGIVSNAIPVIGSYAWSIGELFAGKTTYDVFSDFIVDQTNDTINKIKKLADNDDPNYDDYALLLAKLLDMAGMPVGNLYRLSMGIWDHIQDIRNGEFLDFFPHDQNKADAIDNLYHALVKGDYALIEKLSGNYKNADEYHKAIQSGILRNDSDSVVRAAGRKVEGNIDSYRNIINSIMSKGEFLESDVIAAVESEVDNYRKAVNSLAKAQVREDHAEYERIFDQLKEKGYDSSLINRSVQEVIDNTRNSTKEAWKKQDPVDAYEKDDEYGGVVPYTEKDIVAVFRTGDPNTVKSMMADIQSVYESKGVEDPEGKMHSAIRGGIRTLYDSKEIDYAKANTYLQQYGGLDKVDSYWQLDRWDYDAAHPEDDAPAYSKYHAMREKLDAFQDAGEVVKKYVEMGVSPKSIAGEITKRYKQKYIDADEDTRERMMNLFLALFRAIDYKTDADNKKRINNWLK